MPLLACASRKAGAPGGLITGTRNHNGNCPAVVTGNGNANCIRGSHVHFENENGRQASEILRGRRRANGLRRRTGRNATALIGQFANDMRRTVGHKNWPPPPSASVAGFHCELIVRTHVSINRARSSGKAQSFVGFPTPTTMSPGGRGAM